MRKSVLRRNYISSYGNELLCSVADDGEVLSLQGSTANETAVDVSLSEEACSITCVAGSAVLDRDRLSALLAVELSDDATDELANFFSLLVFDTAWPLPSVVRRSLAYAGACS